METRYGTVSAASTHLTQVLVDFTSLRMLTRESCAPQKGNHAVLKDQVRGQFRANLKEEDPLKIADQKAA